MQKLSYKKYIIILLFIIVLYTLYHFIIYTLYTSQIFAREDGKYVGDIARVSYQIDSLFPRKLEYTLPKQHLRKEEYTEDLPIDILTIGDSFSNAATGGKNPHYQDYLTSYYNKTILNITDTHDHTLHTFEPIIALANKKWFLKHHTNYVIIQSVERFCVMRYAKKFDFTTKKIEMTIKSPQIKNSFIPHINFISTANYKYLYYNLKKHQTTHFHIDVDILELNKKLFSPKKFQNKLLIHHEDILSIPYNTKDNIIRLNNNFNHLAKLLKEQNVTLIFMPNVDKYDLYYPYVQNNPYSQNHFFDYLRALPKEYVFIDTKQILEPLLQQGIKDLYYPDDTHWSYKAIEAIVQDKSFKNLFLQK